MNTIVIVGAGECGVRAAFALRENGFGGTITLIGEEAVLPYERPPLSKSIGADLKEIRAAVDYEKATIDLRLNVCVVKIELDKKSIVLKDGMRIDYDKLLLATGARARLFSAQENFLTLRTQKDAAGIFGQIKQGTGLGIIGAGFIGLELAATARGLGAQVTVFESGSRILSRALPTEISQLLHARHEKEGVDIRVGCHIKSATQNLIVLEDGTEFSFDIIVAGVGAVPNSELAKTSGLQVENGIVVDGVMRTSNEHIFSAGDCCNFPFHGSRIRLESWKVAQDQGNHAAAAMLGIEDSYVKIPWFWSDQYDLTLQVCGLFDTSRKVHIRESIDEQRMVFQCDSSGYLSAAAGVGIANAIAKDIKISEKLIERGRQHSLSELCDPSINLKNFLKAK